MGIIWPMLTVSKSLWIIPLGSNTVSLASGLLQLLSDGHLFLFLIIFLFSIAFPTAKLFLLYRLWYQPLNPTAATKLTHFLAVTGKWSMLDVLVVGMLVVILKLRDLVTVTVDFGVFFFATSVILTMIATSRVLKTIHAPAHLQTRARAQLPAPRSPTFFQRKPGLRLTCAILLAPIALLTGFAGVSIAIMSTEGWPFDSSDIFPASILIGVAAALGYGSIIHFARFRRRNTPAPSLALPQPAAASLDADTAFCPYCGRHTRSDFQFCPSCGKENPIMGQGTDS